jgi:hypothetical protein
VSKKATRNFIPVAIRGYWQRSQRPLSALIFLLPLILVYDLGVLRYATSESFTADIYARSLLRGFFRWFGVTGFYLPGFIVIAVLLAWHLAKRDPIRFEPRLYGLMWAESLLLSLPLFVLAVAMFRQPVTNWCLLAGGADAGGADAAAMELSPQAKLVFSIGAGIYEELLFRLIAIALIHLVLVDIMALPEKVGAAGAIGVSAVSFALYHFSPANPFEWMKFFFYTTAGIYLAAVYVLRGFGIVAGTHALYDVLVVLLELTQS